jgi:hypothetical protein
MTGEPPILLNVRELGGYADFTPLYRELGLQVVSAQGFRKALAALKRVSPQMVIAEFNYAPTYGARISTLEALLAGLQTHPARPRLLLFCEPAHYQYLPLLEAQYGVLQALSYPIDREALRDWLQIS